MSALLALFARTFVIGIAVAAPVGAMSALCVQRTLSHGWRTGAATGLGIATADGTYAALAAFGVAAFSALLVASQAPLRFVGGLVLAWLGWQAMISPPAHVGRSEKAEAASFGGIYAGSVGLTLTNPMTIMAFAAVFASASLGSMANRLQALVATAGVASGSLAWWLALVSAISLVRHAFSDTAAQWVNRISGALIAAFGLVTVGLALWSLRP